jgi:hypothetical protein
MKTKLLVGLIVILLGCSKSNDPNPNQLGCWKGTHGPTQSSVTICEDYSTYKANIANYSNGTWTPISDCSQCK